MSERTLLELSQASKTAFESRNWQEATNCLSEAVERFEQPHGSRLKQGADGSIVIGVQRPKLFRGEPVKDLNDQPLFEEVDELITEEE